MREPSQSAIAFTLHVGDAVEGRRVINAIAKTTGVGRTVPFFVQWETHYVDGVKCLWARLIHTQTTTLMGDPSKSYGFYLTEDFEVCEPLVINPKGAYPKLYLVANSWGTNFIQQLGSKKNFLEDCNSQGARLNAALRTCLQHEMSLP